MADAYGSNYDGGSANGNFVSPSGGDGGMNSPSGEQRRKPTDEKTIIPATIKMLLQAAPNQNIFQDGREADQVKLIAAVRDVQKGSTAYTYRVEDGTGLIEVKEWIDADGNVEATRMREEAAVENTYVRIFGRLSIYEDKPQIVANSVRKITSGNELTHHFLETVHAAEMYKKSRAIVADGSSMNNVNMDFNREAMANGNAMRTSRPIDNRPQAGNGNDQLADEIQDYLSRAPDAENGGSLSAFIAMNAGKYSAQDITQKFNDLSTDGLIYSTIDEDHFSCV